MGSGASYSRRPSSQPSPVQSSADARRFVAPDQEIVVSGEIWKLNSGANPQAPRQWLKRWMWLADTGGLFYYSPQFHKPLGCSVARLEIRTPEAKVLDRYVLELVLENELRVMPTMLAMESEAERDSWVKSIRSVQDAERQAGQDKISPMDPFTGHGLQTDRKRLSVKGLGSSAGGFTTRSNSSALNSGLASVDTGLAGTRSSESLAEGRAHGLAGANSSESLAEGGIRSSLRSAGPAVCPQASIGIGVFAPTAAQRHGSSSSLSPKMRTSIRRNSQAGFADQTQTVLVLDWDDTLFPTTFIRKDLRLDWRCPIVEQVQQGPARDQVEILLDNLSKKVEVFLDQACSLSQVSIITLAAPPWVQTSCENFVPRLGRLLKQKGVEVIYARERISEAARRDYAVQAFHSSADEAEFWMRAKAVAMEEAIGNFYSQGQRESSWKNIISIGDSDFERLALGTTATEHAAKITKGGQALETGITSMGITKDGHLYRLRAKTIKMLDEPSVEELIAQVSLFQSWLPHLISKDSGLDIVFQSSEDDDFLSGVHEFVTGKRETLRWRELAEIQ